MPFGLTHTNYQRIKDIFSLYPNVEEVIIFGSRSLNTCHAGSDIDLALKGIDISLDDILSINSALEELPLAYKYDIIYYHKIKTPELIKHIDKHGLLFYKKEKEKEKLYR
ncbi:MAG: nucleotidyltransferase domain-containing protein [Bacteroidales bacterium]|jgi:predicted nucleotidyltransferase|nr:nucleotidyltransferase domain-containing protein [Bacteroidales bacterium]